MNKKALTRPTILMMLMLLTSCQTSTPIPTQTSPPITQTPVAPTKTPIPPTATIVPPTETLPPTAIRTRINILPGLNTSQEVLAAWYVPVASAATLLNVCTYLQDSAEALQAGEIGIDEMRTIIKDMQDVLGLLMTIVDGWTPTQEQEDIQEGLIATIVGLSWRSEEWEESEDSDEFLYRLGIQCPAAQENLNAIANQAIQEGMDPEEIPTIIERFPEGLMEY